MKAFLGMLLLLVVALGGAGYWYYQNGGRTPKVREERIYSVLESLAFDAFQSAGPQKSKPELRLDQLAGYCVFTVALTAETMRNPVKVLEGGRLRYSVPVLLKDNGLLCGFPTGGKSVLFNPSKESSLLIRRRLNEVGEAILYSGQLSLTSEKLQLDLGFSGAGMRISSKVPVSLAVTAEDGSGAASIIVIQGAVDVVGTYRPEAGEAARPVHFVASASGQVFSEGKQLAVAGQTITLLPGGFGEPTQVPPANPGTAAPLPPGITPAAPAGPPVKLPPPPTNALPPGVAPPGAVVPAAPSPAVPGAPSSK